MNSSRRAGFPAASPHAKIETVRWESVSSKPRMTAQNMHTLRFQINPRLTGALAAALLLISVVLAMPGPAHAEPVDHIAAVINYDVITASELAQAVALNERLGTPAKDRKTLESETLEGLITRKLLVQEAHRLRFVEVSDQEINAELENVRKRFGSDAAFQDFLKTQDMTQEELSRMFGEQLLVEKFVEKKVGLFVRVTREEAETYYHAHADQYQDKSFQDVQKDIMSLLTARKVDEELDRYVAELRSKADIRINPS